MKPGSKPADGANQLDSPGNSILGLHDSHRRSSDLFIRLLAIVYLIAFSSLGVQLRALVGETGILPAGAYLANLLEMLDSRAYTSAPSIFWIHHDDYVIEGACWIGVAIALLVAAGVAQGPLLFVNWVLYLSLVSIGQVFLHFQWDVLLLEAGFLAFWLAPWKAWSSWRHPPEPPLVVVWLVWALVFRLMLSSGWVKIRTDEVWRNLTALDFHYWTQPLPTWTSWWLHHAPEVTRRAAVAATLAIELVLPWAIFLGRPGRRVACIGFAGFQVLLMLSGNFGFFNLLTLALCIPLWSRAMDTETCPVQKTGASASEGGRNPRPLEALLRRRASVPLAILVAILSVAALARTEKRDLVLPKPLDALERNLAPFFLVNRYGLFADMTEVRPELVMEVSRDGVEWKPLPFPWKPGPLEKRPRFTMLHMPRLDWQMWFEALNFLAQDGYYSAREVHPEARTYYANLWFYRFARRVLEAPNAATELLGDFPDGSPPRFVRATVYRYRFSTPEERRKSGNWWVRQRIGVYLPVMEGRSPSDSGSDRSR